MAGHNARPTKALLLSAGLGVRMRPLSSDLPKAMMPLWGKPLLGHMLDLVERWGVRDVLINLHHNPGPILDYVASRQTGRLRINFSFESEIMGTGGALRFADWFFDEPDAKSFWVLNTDIAATLSCDPLLREFRKGRTLAALWLTQATGPRTVEMRKQRISGFRTDSPGRSGTYTFCGVHLVSSRIFSYLPTRRASSIISAYEEAMRNGEQVRGAVVSRSFWADLGTPESYIAAHRSVLNRYRDRGPGNQLLDPELLKRQHELCRSGVHIDGFAAVAPTARISPGARLSDSVVWDDARLGPDTVVSNAVVGRAVNFNSPIRRAAVACGPVVEHDPALRTLLHRLRWAVGSTVIIPMEPTGSDRSFLRLARGRKSVILIRYGRERAENSRYATHARFLSKRKAPVPAILLDDPDHRLVVIEDLGTHSLHDEIADLSTDAIERLYRQVIDAAVIMHGTSRVQLSRNNVQLEPPFSKTVYRWERELFARHFLTGICGLSRSRIAGAMTDLKHISDILAEAPPVLVHRDLQSSNILIRRRCPFFIDFQGMRLGPAAYDFASLLCDPYVMLPVPLQKRLIRYCLSVSPNTHAVDAYFWYAAAERLAQALGAFGRLAQIQGTERFAAHIPAALQMMDRALSRLDGLPHLKKLVGSVNRPETAF